MEAASSVNAPHPDASTDDVEDFFADSSESVGEPDASGPLTELARKEEAYQYSLGHGEPISPELQAAHEEYQQTADREQAEWDGAAPAHAQEVELPAAEEPEPETPTAETTGGGTGNVAREYIVFQKVPLTEKTLRALLAQIEEGVKPRVAFIELARATTRNDKQAIGEVYLAHEKELGERCELAAVSGRAFKERKIAPEEVPAERRIKIS